MKVKWFDINTMIAPTSYFNKCSVKFFELAVHTKHIYEFILM